MRCTHCDVLGERIEKLEAEITAWESVVDGEKANTAKAEKVVEAARKVSHAHEEGASISVALLIRKLDKALKDYDKDKA